MHKRQDTFFDSNEMPENEWAWIVEKKFIFPALPGECEWRIVPRPNHFRKESDAVKRAEDLNGEFHRAYELKLVEFRVVPKYIGYVPGEDETWIQ